MAQEIEQVQPSFIEVVASLNKINESFLGPRLVIEAFSRSDVPKMCLYLITDQSSLLLASYGFDQNEQTLELDASKIQSGYYIENPVSFAGEKLKLFMLGKKHFIATPLNMILSTEVEEELQRIGNLADVDPINSGLFYPLERFSSSSSHQLVTHGVALNMKTISLFTLNFSEIISFVSTYCPLSFTQALVFQLGQFGQSLLAGTGVCRLLSSNRLLCAQYGRLPGDPELISVQICKTYSHTLAMPEISVKASGPYASVSIAGEAVESAEAAIQSFTNGLGTD